MLFVLLSYGITIYRAQREADIKKITDQKFLSYKSTLMTTHPWVINYVLHIYTTE